MMMKMNTFEEAGAKALATLRERDIGETPPELFARISDSLSAPENRREGRAQFWQGSLFGAAVAASVLAIAVSFGWSGSQATPDSSTAQFQVLVGEPRTMDIAIEVDRPLVNATISVLLAGDVALDGYGKQRELTWQTDLNAGVNRLSLPVFALDRDGGQMIVRLNHPQSEQMFMVRLNAES